MKKLLVGLGLIVATGLVSTDVEAGIGQACYKKFDNQQLANMQDAYDYGKRRGYAWTLAAMAWQETSAGKQMINWNDPSFGIIQINMNTAIKRYKLKTWKQQLDFANKLATSNKFAVNAAADELDFWKGVHKGDFRKMWASYNGGYNWKSKHPQAYSKGISNKIAFLKANRCLFTRVIK